MLKFKSFRNGSYTDQDITEFFNENLIENSRILENGDIFVYYRELDAIGMAPIDKVERLDKSIREAELQVFDAERGLEESERELADIEEKISKAHPNDKEQWDGLQQARTFHKGQIIMHRGTLETRGKQIVDLRLAISQIEVGSKNTNNERKEG